MCHDESGTLYLRDDIRHREGFSRSGRTEQRLHLHAAIQAVHQGINRSRLIACGRIITDYFESSVCHGISPLSSLSLLHFITNILFVSSSEYIAPQNDFIKDGINRDKLPVAPAYATIFCRWTDAIWVIRNAASDGHSFSAQVVKWQTQGT